jgi:hypothetical protein
MRLNKDLKEFVELLNANRVEYLVVGAFAVAWHGYARFTADIDFLVRPTAANAEAVLAVFRQFGFGDLKIAAADLSRSDQIVQLGVKPNRIDIITSIAGVSFDQAWAGRVHGFIDEVPVPFLGREDLIRNKEATGRPRDVGDAAELRKRKPSV